ncbi:hypothetical protein BDF20DRAFT_901055 [Mycotypha africana]|uniref:uncharacterized protein n=1 Tax=Mycotypha africana TaxID=64632 RepID=UPI00230157F4|nr:uncharacterized protein BDF20DRAFT_901055 [Mycotypha africana]KAI8967437.1 hypothetical protein BDF20DRAFT_901055 [Mycotypha africana]
MLNQIQTHIYTHAPTHTHTNEFFTPTFAVLQQIISLIYSLHALNLSLRVRACLQQN